ncbi:hypothetical protein B0T10DRAFT_495042, partial [Thelonectria olida]
MTNHLRVPNENFPPSATESDGLESDSETKSIIIDEWRGPQTLKRGALVVTLSLTWDIILTLGPICFIVLAILALRLDGHTISSYGDQLRDFTLVSPTIYPILFAAITSRFYKNLARWRLESRNGIRLAELEQIFGSQSLAGAIERLLFVRTHIILGLMIFLTWGLSPLGGQSAARLVSTKVAESIATGSVYYMPLNYFYDGTGVRGDYSGLGVDYITDALYLSSLFASSSLRQSPTDLWDLPKIPQLPSTIKDGEVYNVNHGALLNGDAHYTSLLGRRVQGLNYAQGNTTYEFIVESSYVDIQCLLLNSSVPYNASTDYVSKAELNTTLLEQGPWGNLFFGFVANMSVPDTTDLEFALKKPPGYMLFAIFRFSGFGLFNCTTQATVLETSMQCHPTSSSARCQAKSQKRVSNQNNENRYPPDILTGRWIRQVLLHTWRLSGADTMMGSTSPTVSYLGNTLDPFSKDRGMDWTNLNESDFSRRLTTLFNTYQEAFSTPRNQPSTTFMDTPVLDASNSTMFNETASKATTYVEVYDTQHKWVSLLIAATMLLEMLAIGGLVLKYFVHGPDLLGFASSMTRDNPYIPVAPGGTTLDGPERARVLGNMRVQIADVRSSDEIGYIAMRSIPGPDYSGEETGDSRVELSRGLLGKNRLY